jgi:hypothetical protein
MNTDETSFDRLVDDELSEKERREILGRLDDEPGGWRRCALAFLEAQCWKQSLGEISNDREESPKTTLARNPQRSPWAGRMGLLSAMAASFLVAMWLGTAAHRAWVGHSDVSGTTGEIAGKPNVPRPVFTPDRHENALASAQPRNAAAPNPWHTVTVSVPNDGRPLVDVPAVERDRFDEQFFQNMPPAIPDNVMQALNRTGHQVQQRREFMPVSLKDGRQMIVPVDHVDVHYIGNGPY